MMDNPYYGQWDNDDIDNVGWNENGEPYVRPTRGVSDGQYNDLVGDAVADKYELIWLVKILSKDSR